MWLNLSTLQMRNLILKYLEEADEFLNKGDLVDACEKYYKATEDFLKYIAIVDNMSEILNQVNAKNYWESELLFKVVKKKVELKDIWKAAWKLHTDCFHEERMNLREVKTLASVIKAISNRI